MCCYTHLTLTEREDIMCLLTVGKGVSEIAGLLGRSKSSVSREINRNSPAQTYRALLAQKRYEKQRAKCKRRLKLSDPVLYALVAEKFLGLQWSPEQIEGRFRLEGVHPISDSTIYPAIDRGMFDDELGGRKARRRLRHKGRRRKSAAHEERRGKMSISHDLDERPDEANSRTRLGDWEADTVLGKQSGACLVTLVDRSSRLLVGGKAASKGAEAVGDVMMRKLAGQPCLSVTPDRGKESARHHKIAEKIGAEFYFPPPGQPWQRGTNENTNGLLREYFPKGRPLDDVTEEEIQAVYDRLNRRLRKIHGYRCPYEVHYSTSLHLI